MPVRRLVTLARLLVCRTATPSRRCWRNSCGFKAVYIIIILCVLNQMQGLVKQSAAPICGSYNVGTSPPISSPIHVAWRHHLAQHWEAQQASETLPEQTGVGELTHLKLQLGA